MNILYIGPYRQDNINGWSSTALLHHLLSSNKHNITCRPIYLEPSNNITEVDTKIINAENNTCSNYDAIIQHAHIDALINIQAIDKNIAIPILTEKQLDDDAINNLSSFDKILVDTKLMYNRLQQYPKVQNKVKTYDYSIDSKPLMNSSFRIGILECSKKIYFIGKYNTNIDNIINLCKAFISNISIHEYTLILFLFDLDANKKNHIESLINKCYMLYNMKYTINRIVLVPIDTKLDNLLVAHQTGDIYIDLQDDNSNTLNTKTATLLNKPIVQFGYEDMVFRFDRNNQSYPMGCVGISEQAIHKAMKNCIFGGSEYSPKPFKKDNILNLI